MTDTPLTAKELAQMLSLIEHKWPVTCAKLRPHIAALTERAEKAEARVAELEAALGGADPFPVALAAMQWATALDALERIVLERRLREELLKWRAALEGTQ